jgi:hypothetical protein
VEQRAPQRGIQVVELGQLELGDEGHALKLTRLLAYVFWHRPAGSADPAGYEARLAAFHDRLRADPPAGFRRSVAFRVDVPWIGAGYEDWYLVDDWHAVGVLNAAAVDAAHRHDHDAVAHESGTGAGGLFALKAGDLELPQAGAAAWAHEPPSTPERGFALWQRQMVLGPAPEYCLLTPGESLRRVAGG